MVRAALVRGRARVRELGKGQDACAHGEAAALRGRVRRPRGWAPPPRPLAPPRRPAAARLHALRSSPQQPQSGRLRRVEANGMGGVRAASTERAWLWHATGRERARHAGLTAPSPCPPPPHARAHKRCCPSTPAAMLGALTWDDRHDRGINHTQPLHPVHAQLSVHHRASRGGGTHLPPWGGVLWGGVLWGGVLWGGVLWAGVLWGGVLWGGGGGCGV